jgi:hypothetical protein
MANKINVLATPRQSFSYAIANKKLEINLYYSENLSCFLTSLTYGSFAINNLRIVDNYNILGKYKNVIPFGIQIYGKQDPYFIDDFEKGNNEFLILNKEEAKEI